MQISPTHVGPSARRGIGASVLWMLVATWAVVAPPLVSGQGVHQAARSEAGMVTTAHPLATVAGSRILEMGGNAADAAVAAAFAVAVVRPSMNSIGGRNQILVHTADGQFHGIDGTTQVPIGYDPETAPEAEFGYATVGVPGALAGLMRLHSEHGSLPLETVMQPAIHFAEQGFRLLRQQAGFHARSAEALAESEGGRMHYLKPDGSPYREGELFVQEALGATLRKIVGGGHDVFYKGELALVMIADMEANDGFVNRESLESYEALDSRIVRGSYRGYDLVGTDVPASGAVSIQALQIMENFDAHSMDDEEWAAVIGQAIGLASPDRRALGTDTAAARATSKEWAAQQAEKIRLVAKAAADEAAVERGAGFGNAPTGVPGASAGNAPAVAGGSDGIDPTAFPPDWDAEHYTTHLSTADSTGMAVALTQTIGPAMGSKVAVPGMGMLYASTLGGYLGSDLTPGYRARSSISPLMVMKDGELLLVLGSAGGARIVSSVVQAVSRVVDDGMTLQAALAAPRVHPESDGTIDMEMSAGWNQGDVAGIRAIGLEISETERIGAFGRVQAIRYDPETGEWEGVSDPDSEGTARGPGPALARWP
jgi:gamma-glutamyltranspeptidase/glutathione hydrolase